MARTKKKTDYRELKKVLNKYFDFSFEMPRKGKDFTPQQKSALTRRYRKISEFINNPTVSYIPYPKGSKLPNVDAVRTSKGIFYKYPGAVAKFNKADKKWHIVVSPKLKKGAKLVQKRRDILFLFPNSILDNPELIQQYVAALEEKYKPHDIRWSNKSTRESQRYDPSIFSFYFQLNIVDQDSGEEFDESELSDDEILEMLSTDDQRKVWKKRKYSAKQAQDRTFYNGVFLVYYL